MQALSRLSSWIRFNPAFKEEIDSHYSDTFPDLFIMCLTSDNFKVQLSALKAMGELLSPRSSLLATDSMCRSLVDLYTSTRELLEADASMSKEERESRFEVVRGVIEHFQIFHFDSKLVRDHDITSILLQELSRVDSYTRWV